MSSEKHPQIEWYSGALVFITFIGAHLIFGGKAAVRVAGIACVVTGFLWILRRSVPFGIEGGAPSLYLKG